MRRRGGGRHLGTGRQRPPPCPVTAGWARVALPPRSLPPAKVVPYVSGCWHSLGKQRMWTEIIRNPGEWTWPEDTREPPGPPSESTGSEGPGALWFSSCGLLASPRAAWSRPALQGQLGWMVKNPRCSCNPPLSPGAGRRREPASQGLCWISVPREVGIEETGGAGGLAWMGSPLSGLRVSICCRSGRVFRLSSHVGVYPLLQTDLPCESAAPSPCSAHEPRRDPGHRRQRLGRGLRRGSHLVYIEGCDAARVHRRPPRGQHHTRHYVIISV